MAWIQSILAAENGSATQLLVITICIVILLILVTWIFRKIVGTAARKKARNRIPRLSITDWTSVGEKHQLVLVRRDNVEHLILIGGNSDVVVEQNIVRVQANAQTRQDKQPAPLSPVQNVKADNNDNTVAAVAATTVAAAAVTSPSEGAEDNVSTEEPPIISTSNETPQEPGPQPEVSVSTVEPPQAKTPEVQMEETAAADENTHAFEDDLIASIAGSLEDDIKPASEQTGTENETDTSVTSETASEKSDDEMQRLLDELATETKESVETKEPA